jgi:glutathione-regulated potassium-efflux system ancillary protein KefF
MICVIYAHPYPARSRANKQLLRAIADLPSLTLHSLYDRYPDFAIDVEAEQRALAKAHVIVLQHPFYWYGVPGMLKHWFDKVLSVGWAYGSGRALAGKRCLWVTTTGAGEPAYSAEGVHGRPFEAFVPAIEQTARFCGMEFLTPRVLFAAHRISDDALAQHARDYREQLLTLSRLEPSP